MHQMNNAFQFRGLILSACLPDAADPTEQPSTITTKGKAPADVSLVVPTDEDITVGLTGELIEDGMVEGIDLPEQVQILHEWYKKYQLTPKMKAFLGAVVVTAGNLTLAARAVPIAIWSHYRWLEESADYKAAFNTAKSLAADTLLSEAIRRAHQGTTKPVFYKGEVCGSIREYSDSLMLALLKAKFPEEFRERSEAKVTAAVEAC